ncbi:HDOD domain-containing protein [Opitutus sp. ER46]|uniref:HDOD domain-containing protein n=1 Tax=Opitutus sp. ER46 TaxID=2161864 RepID=UPI001304FC21|nr:HDOD domain-containing protein [Opitutus sp. ER46]
MSNHQSVSLEEVVRRAADLPSAPWLLPKLMEQLADPDSAAGQVEALIKVDAALAAGTLRLANSAFLNAAMPCDSLTDAIVRLGYREIYRLATTKIAARWLTHEVKGYGWQPGDLYAHSLATAVAADLLARHYGTVDAEIAYTAGLLHDVGKLALAYTCGEYFSCVRDYQAREQCPWRVAELQIFGFDHTQVAAGLVRSWDFPESLVDVVGFYPRPGAASPQHRPLVAIVHAAKHLALCLGTGVGEDGFTSELDEAVLRNEGIAPEVAERLLPSVVELTSRLLHPSPAR